MSAPADVTGILGRKQPHCVVVEWEDGTIQVFGPCSDYSAACDRATGLTEKLAKGRKVADLSDGSRSWFRIGDEDAGEDTMDVYAQILNEG